MWLIDDIFEESVQKRLQKGSIVAVGAFDGIHWGHRLILEEMNRITRKETMTGLVVTFNPHPREVIDPEGPPFLITTFEEKVKILADLGIDALAVISFDEVSSLSPWEFVHRYIAEGAHAKGVLSGYNHTFGKGGVGNVSALKAFGEQLGYRLWVIPPLSIGGEIVSSTRVRETITGGNMEMCGRLLGRKYSLKGTVVKGEGKGKSLGFPTANLRVEKRKLFPKDGVYAVMVDVEGRSLSGVMNIGFRPTFGGDFRTAEVHIIDFSGNLYGSEIEVEFMFRLRDEIPFHDSYTLKLQMEEDKERVLVSF
jgi:riboflavin kinase/FMN adenylyltransferase